MLTAAVLGTTRPDLKPNTEPGLRLWTEKEHRSAETTSVTLPIANVVACGLSVGSYRRDDRRSATVVAPFRQPF